MRTPWARRRAQQTRPAPLPACRAAPPGADSGTRDSNKACLTSVLILDVLRPAPIRLSGRIQLCATLIPMRKTALRPTLAAFLAFAALAAPPAPNHAQQPVADGQQQFADLGVCKLANGQQITGCRLGYRTWGKFNDDRSNAVF